VHARSASRPARAAALQAKPGGKIRIARSQESDSLDPHKSTLLVAHEVMYQIFDSLIYLAGDGTVKPGAAVSWELSDGNRTLTFKLRPNLKFHDGTPVNAEAVKFTVDRHLDPAIASPTKWMHGPIDSVSAVDEMTVAYHYKEPFVPVFVGLSFSYLAPISPAAVQKFGDDFARNPVGSGPFKFVSWMPDQGIELERNPEHDWGTPFFKNTGAPYLEGATYVVIPEDSTRLAALTAGDVDAVSGTNAVPADKAKTLAETPGIKIITGNGPNAWMFELNTTRPPFSDLRVRQAVNHAVDQQKLVDLYLSGYGKPGISLAGSALPGHKPDVTTYPYNPDKARELLKEAGVSGVTVKALVIDTPAYRRMAEIVQADLKAVGITMDITALPVGELFAAGPKLEADMVHFGYTWGPDPDLIGGFVASDGPYNFTGYKNPALDEKIKAQRSEFDMAKRMALVGEIQEEAARQALFLMLPEEQYIAAVRDYVMDLTLDAVGFHHLQDIWLNK